MDNEIKDRSNSVSFNTINVSGDVKGSVIGSNSGVVTNNFPKEISAEELHQLMEEIKIAQNIISNLNDVTDFQKEYLLGIIDETNQALNSGSSDEVNKSKKNFTDTIKIMGNVGVKVISALAGVTNLLKFFGISL